MPAPAPTLRDACPLGSADTTPAGPPEDAGEELAPPTPRSAPVWQKPPTWQEAAEAARAVLEQPDVVWSSEGYLSDGHLARVDIPARPSAVRYAVLRWMLGEGLHRADAAALLGLTRQALAYLLHEAPAPRHPPCPRAVAGAALLALQHPVAGAEPGTRAWMRLERARERAVALAGGRP